MDKLFISALLVVIAIWLLVATAPDLPWTVDLRGVLPRLAYSCVLLIAVAFLTWEITRVWKPNNTPAIGAFQLTSGGKSDDIRAKALRSLIVQRHNAIKEAIHKENERRRNAKVIAEDFESAAVPVLTTPSEKVGLSGRTLAELELKVQGINFGQLLASLRGLFVSPGEITGTVVLAGSGDEVSAIVRWPTAPSPKSETGENNRLMSLDTVANDGEIALEVACSLIWAELLAYPESQVQGLSRKHYCMWLKALLTRVDIEAIVNARILLSEADTKKLKLARRDLDFLYGQSLDFAEIYALRAALISLDPDSDADDRREAERNLITYNRLLKKEPLNVALAVSLSDPEDTKTPELAAIIAAASRPVLQLRDASIAGPVPMLWSDTVSASEGFIGKVANATGYLSGGNVTGDSPLTATAFIIGPDLVATAYFLASYIRPADTQQPFSQAYFSLEEDALDKSAKRYRVTEVVARDEAIGIAVFRVPELRGVGVDAVVFGNERPPPGGDMAVIGYPVYDARLDERISVARQRLYVKRVMFGKFLADEAAAIAGLPGAMNVITHDASTSAGTSGAPVIDLEDGTVVAVHVGGRTDPGTGEKQNFAVPINEAALKALLGSSAER